jgi:DNA-binding NarL/FixJ family response regulator
MMAILIVERHAGMREMLRHMVEPYEAKVYDCSDGADASRLLAQLRPDWVVLDIAMPVEEWVEAARRIKSSDPGARVIVVSDHDDPELRKAAADAGASAYVLRDNLTALTELIRGGGSR